MAVNPSIYLSICHFFWELLKLESFTYLTIWYMWTMYLDHIYSPLLLPTFCYIPSLRSASSHLPLLTHRVHYALPAGMLADLIDLIVYRSYSVSSWGPQPCHVQKTATVTTSFPGMSIVLLLTLDFLSLICDPLDLFCMRYAVFEHEISLSHRTMCLNTWPQLLLISWEVVEGEVGP